MGIQSRAIRDPPRIHPTFGAFYQAGDRPVTPTLRARLLTAVKAIQDAGKISEVAERLDCGRMTIYRALKSPNSVRVGMADKLIAAASEALNKQF